MKPEDCPHPDFAVKVGVHRLTDGDNGPVTNYLAEIEIHCTECKEPFHFLGADAGYSPHRPTVNVGATMLNAPIAPGEAPMPATIRYEMPASRRTAS